MRPLALECGDLLAEDIDIEIGRRQDHIADLGRDPAVADRHLPERLDRKPGAHRMGHDGDFADRRIVSGELQ